MLFLLFLTGLGERLSAGPADSVWVDSVFRSLSPEQRIAQVMVIRAYSCRDSVYADSLSQVVRRFNLGGVCFFKGYPVNQAMLTNRLQKEAQTPLLITTDAEWGLGMRMDSAFSFPRQMALGAIDDDSLIYRMGREVAKSCLRLGVTVNFAPVADVNNNPKNPVISFRSFGERPAEVARKCMMYMRGMQDGGIMAVAKHFPGHGDTETDSHLDLPAISHTEARMDSVELLPFQTLISGGVKGIMVGHLYVPCFDTAQNVAATLSKNIVTGLLKGKMGFGGYVITDALDMQGAAKKFKPGEIEVKALQAGNDILLLPKHADIAVQAIKTAADSGILSWALIDSECRRMLALKKVLGLDQWKPVDTVRLATDLNTPEAEALRQAMVNESMTLVKNDLRVIPLTGLERRKFAVIAAGDTLPNVFQSALGRHFAFDCFRIPEKCPKTVADSILKQVRSADFVILAVHGINSNVADSFGLKRPMVQFIDSVIRSNRTILVHFGTPYALDRIPARGKTEALLVAYQDNPTTEQAAAEVIAGGIGAKGTLPVTASPFRVGTGDETDKVRMEAICPEIIGIPRSALHSIDSIAECGIESGAYPGCQVLLAKDGKIFYEKAFGHPRYGDTTLVTTTDLYDLASVTKVAATTLCIMKLADKGLLTLSDTLGKYLAFLKGSNKAGLRIRDVMAHQAGLQDWIPFYKATLRNGKPNPAIYRPEQSAGFPVRVASGLYIRKDYADTLYKLIRNSPLRPQRDYRYSDLGFYLLRRITEQLSGIPFEQFTDREFYKPLGLQTAGFNPRNRFGLSRIIPTEYDAEFRKQLVWGDVHDPGAAMLGGVSGHAGLFSDAYDVAVLLQMLLWDGTYGGREYLSQATVSDFTRVQYPEKGNRRGAGFDKPPFHYFPDGPVCKSASPRSFGHSGFTGTYIWADPENGLVYIFLSNRVCPSSGNQKLSEMNIRTAIHQTAYDLLRKYQVK